VDISISCLDVHGSAVRNRRSDFGGGRNLTDSRQQTDASSHCSTQLYQPRPHHPLLPLLPLIWSLAFIQQELTIPWLSVSQLWLRRYSDHGGGCQLDAISSCGGLVMSSCAWMQRSSAERCDDPSLISPLVFAFLCPVVLVLLSSLSHSVSLTVSLCSASGSWRCLDPPSVAAIAPITAFITVQIHRSRPASHSSSLPSPCVGRLR
jgi:hypothetical protein